MFPGSLLVAATTFLWEYMVVASAKLEFDLSESSEALCSDICALADITAAVSALIVKFVRPQISMIIPATRMQARVKEYSFICFLVFAVQRLASVADIHVPLSDQWTKARPGPPVHCKLMFGKLMSLLPIQCEDSSSTSKRAVMSIFQS